MKRLILIAALFPFAAMAQPINTLNNPNQPGYQNPSQQRMQTQMQSQQIQQQGMLNQQLQTQTRVQQQHLQTQINTNSQRVQESQPGERYLPNTNGGMLNGGTNQSGVQQQHMLSQPAAPSSGGTMLNP